MLVEIRCDQFRDDAIHFSSGLNVILGDENATNSIGKSTLLMIIDFVFGGTTLLTHNKDIITELGHHEYLFSFKFEQRKLYLRRGTQAPENIFVCKPNYEIERTISVDEYTAILKQAYDIDLPDISFRGLVGLYLRIWGKPNLSVEHPLHNVPAQKARECVDMLVKAFNLYGGISDLSSALHKLESESSALRAAQRHAFVPKINKSEYKKTQEQIASLERDLQDIRDNLSSYATNLASIMNKEVLNLKLRKDELLRTRMNVAGRLQRAERNLENNKSIRSKNFNDLLSFFPSINEDRLLEVETFHSGVAKILRNELLESQRQLTQELASIDSVIASIDAEMAVALGSVEKPDSLVDHIYNVATSLHQATISKISYEQTNLLSEQVKTSKRHLENEKLRILYKIEKIINDEMREIATYAIGTDRKSPTITLRDDGYAFDVEEDTGTGTAYVALALFDLAIFHTTQLPVIVHDSIIFKNIENDSVARLINVYMQTTKQSFIALDEIDKYGDYAVQLLLSNKVIQLSNEHVLYVKDWRHHQ